MGDTGSVLLVGNVDDSPARAVKIEKFLQVITPIAERVHLVAGCRPTDAAWDVDFLKVTNVLDDGGPLPIQVLNHVLVQVALALAVFRKRHDHETIVLFMGYSGAAIAGRLLGKNVVRFHGGPAFNGHWYEAITLEKIPNTMADRILVPSESCVEHFDLSNHREKIFTAHFHVDEAFQVDTPFEERARRIGYIGHLTELKGVDTLVTAVHRANERLDEPIELVLGGNGYLAEDLDLDAPYISYRGWIDHADAPTVYNELRAFMLLSESEGLPTVVLESLACGTPVVATRVGGVPDVVSDGENGRLLDERPPEKVAGVLVDLFDDELLQEYHEHARATIDRSHRIDGVRERFQEVLTFD